MWSENNLQDLSLCLSRKTTSLLLPCGPRDQTQVRLSKKCLDRLNHLASLTSGLGMGYTRTPVQTIFRIKALELVLHFLANLIRFRG